MAKYKYSLRRWELAALLSLGLILCICVWAQGRQDSISSSLVRLHVVAVSDDAREQEIKLKVRDAVLEYISPSLSGADSVQTARGLIARDLKGIAAAAASASEGRRVTVSLDREIFPTKEYRGFTLPAGSYDSLRIVLGEGEGHNWWCIVFPPVCLSAVQAEQVCDAMAPQDYALISGAEGYELRLRSLELWGELKALLSGNDLDCNKSKNGL